MNGDEIEPANRAARLTQWGLAIQVAATAAALWSAYTSQSFLALGIAVHLLAGGLAWVAGMVLVRARIGRVPHKA